MPAYPARGVPADQQSPGENTRGGWVALTRERRASGGVAGFVCLFVTGAAGFADVARK